MSDGRSGEKVLMVSGGKDSTYLIHYCQENDIPIDRYVFLDTGLHLPAVYDWLNTIESEYEIKIERKTPKWDFEDKFYQEISSGKNEGDIRGYPWMVTPCWIRRDFKLKNWKYEGETRVLGYTADEPNRDNKEQDILAPLRENNITEGIVINRLRKLDMYPPIYELLEKYGVSKPRSGCYLCPKAPIGWYVMLQKEFPKYFEKMVNYAKDDPKQFKPDMSIDELKKKVQDSDFVKRQRKLESYIRSN